MAVKLVTKQLQLSLEDQKLKAEGQDFSVTVNVETVRAVFQSAVALIGVENCAKFTMVGAGAVAMFVAGNALVRKWPWFQGTSIEQENTLKMEIPASREEEFNKLMKDGKVQREVKESLEDIGSNLLGILGQEEYVKNGQKIIDLLKDIRAAKVEEVGGESDSTGTAAIYLKDSIWMQKSENVNNIAVRTSENKRRGQFGAIVATGSTIGGSAQGGMNLALEVNDAKEADKIIKAAKGDKYEVRIWSELYNKDFVEKFDGSVTLRNVRRALENARPIPGNYRIKIGNKVDIDENTATVSYADNISTARNWEAIARE